MSVRSGTVAESISRAIKIIATSVSAAYGPRLISLAVFGSAARGTARPDSDIDLLIVADPLPRGRMKRIADHGDIDFIPTEEYSPAVSRQAMREAAWVVKLSFKGTQVRCKRPAD